MVMRLALEALGLGQQSLSYRSTQRRRTHMLASCVAGADAAASTGVELDGGRGDGANGHDADHDGNDLTDAEDRHGVICRSKDYRI